MTPAPPTDRLRAAGLLRAAPRAARLMAGGYKNAVWRLDLAEDTLVAKVFARGGASETNPLFPNLPEAEAAVLRHLAGVGVAPDFLGFLPETADAPALLLYRFLEGSLWGERGPGDVQAAARLLARAHRLAPPAGVRVLPITAEAVLVQADAVLACAPGARLPVGLRPSPGPTRRARPCLVHTDCGPGNIVETAAGLRLIDWQCPGVGDAIEDVVCFLSPAMQILFAREPLTAEHAAAFLAEYDAADPGAAMAERVAAEAGPWRWRIAAYCAYRAEALADAEPDVAARYRRALAAELAMLEEAGR